MSTREILTLQFGHYSNHVGTHFWNIQELSFDYTGTEKSECNNDILYREGRNTKGEITYTPRLLISDLRDSLKSLPANGGLPDEDVQEDFKWGAVEKIQEPVAQKNEYLADIDKKSLHEILSKQYQLENQISTWTDYLYPRLHSRTINVVKEYQQGSNESFDIYHTGQSLWKKDYGESFSDKIRNYVEECDSIQGFHVNFDCVDGFAGLALGCIEHLTDEYSKSILAHPIIPSYFPDSDPSTDEEKEISTGKDTQRIVNIAFSLSELTQLATLFVPLCTGSKGWRKPGKPIVFDYLNYKPELYYHSASILASALDTLSYKYRLKSNIYTLSDACADMNGYGRKMAAASLRLPFAIPEEQYINEFLELNEKSLYTPITPSCEIAPDKIFQLITIRGIEEYLMKRDERNPRYSNIKEMFELYFQANHFLSATNVTICEKPLQIKPPFPNIFSDKLNKFGFVTNEKNQTKVESCALMAGYHNGNFLSNTIESLRKEVGRIKFAKLHKFSGEGCEAEEFKERLETLSEFQNNYEECLEL
ncbi:protein misato [Papilio machaon]|uniref:protein misato n=1 Tax=Papilio machaon TaxID=76193 RepID=UPI001E664311|nr:protein misato [Papilio machaon]